MKRLYRSEDDKVIAGVHGGIGEYFSIDPIIVRVVGIIIALITGILPYALIYLLLIFVVPKKSDDVRVVEDND